MRFTPFNARHRFDAKSCAVRHRRHGPHGAIYVDGLTPREVAAVLRRALALVGALTRASPVPGAAEVTIRVLPDSE